MRLCPARLPAAALGAAMLAGCASFPEVEAYESRASQSAPWPALAPQGEFDTAEAAMTVRDTDTAALEARAARLRARAAALRRAGG